MLTKLSNFPRLKHPNKGDEIVDPTRRRALGLAAAAPFVLLGLAASAKAADAPACYDYDLMPANQKSMRLSLGFKDASQDPNKHCGLCRFFTASSGGCGTCVLLSGGAVSSGSVCDSWTAKS